MTRSLWFLVVLALGCGTTNPPCSVANCPSGCCDAQNVCQSGASNAACGSGGVVCVACSATQACTAGSCFESGAGGGAGGGGGVAPRLVVMPFGDEANPVVMEKGGEVEFTARADGLPVPGVSFSLMDISSAGAGLIEVTGPHTARFVSTLSGFASAKVRVAADGLSSLATVVSLVDTGTRRLRVAPTEYIEMSRLGYVVSPNTKQTFAVVDRLFSSTNARGVENVDWYLWSSSGPDTLALNDADKPTNGTTWLRNPGVARVYAKDLLSGQWSNTDALVETTTQPSIEVTPSVSTVSPGGVVQLTALVSTGAAVSWQLLANNSGTVSSDGLYTAPVTPGIYVVRALPSGGDGMHYGLATVVVR